MNDAPEIVTIPINKTDPYFGGGTFLATIAYPDDPRRRAIFMMALARDAIEKRMKDSPQWRRRVQLIRPAYFSGDQGAHDKNLKAGMKRLDDRLLMANFSVIPFLRELVTGQPEMIEGLRLTVENALIAAEAYRGNKGDNLATTKTRRWGPTKPVAHAAAAFALWEQGVWPGAYEDVENDPILALMINPEYLDEVVSLSEEFRALIPRISRYNIQPHQMIQFAARTMEEEVLANFLDEALPSDIVITVARRRPSE